MNNRMSKSQNPLTGQMSGSMANFVTTSRGGQNIIRSKAFNPKDAKTEAQLKQRGGFKLVSEEYKTFGGVVDQGFPERQIGQSAYNLFMAANLSVAVDKSEAEVVIDYSKLVIAKGSLPVVTINGGSIDASGIMVRYQTNLKIPKVSAMDEVVVVAKTISGELLVESQQRGTQPEGSILLPYPGLQAADLACCYLFVCNADGSKASGSVYVPMA